jgi:hypothetical protein
MPAHLTVDQKRMAFRLWVRGLSLRQIGPKVGCSGMGVLVVLRDRQKIPERAARLAVRPCLFSCPLSPETSVHYVVNSHTPAPANAAF